MTDFAPSVKDSGRTVIKVIYIVTAGVCVIYMLLGIVASGVVPVSEAANKPLTVAARVVFGDNQVLFSLFIIGACSRCSVDNIKLKLCVVFQFAYKNL